MSYTAALAACVLVLTYTVNVGIDARALPYTYRGDSMFYHLIAKRLTDGGWFLDVPELGSPGTLNLRDVPKSDNNLHVLMMWMLAQGTSHYPSVLNGFFLLTFPLVFLTSLAVIRHVGVCWPVAVSVSLLYTFAPFHLARGEHHLFLAAYWPVPLAVLLALWVIRNELITSPGDSGATRRSKLLVSLLICATLATTGFYFAFFACFFLLVAGVAVAVSQKGWRPLWPALALVVVITGGVAINLLPSLMQFASDGTSAIVRRDAADAEEYGLRIAQLLMPVTGHRLFDLARLKEVYNHRPMVNENDDASLGLVGSIGFLGLIWVFFFRRSVNHGTGDRGPANVVQHLGTLNAAGMLLGTIGGFGSIVAYFWVPQVRAYNRISLFLAFFALLAVAIWMDQYLKRCSDSWRRAAVYVGLPLLTIVALADQIAPRMLPDSTAVASEFTSDAAFVRAIEAQLPAGSRVFQLPYMPFPESDPKGRMLDYDPLRGYLHSTHLRWSYGTIRGRVGNAWLRQTATQPIDELLDTLVWADFNGLWVDRFGFQDDGVRVIEQLKVRLADAPLSSADGRFLFYDLRPHRARLLQDTPAVDWAAKREAALSPLLAIWGDSFYDQEGEPAGWWRWAGASGRLDLFNGSTHARRVRLGMRLVGVDGGHVRIESPLLDSPLDAPISRDGREVAQVLTVPPGRHPLRFSADATTLFPPGDFRTLVFSVHDFQVTPTTE